MFLMNKKNLDFDTAIQILKADKLRSAKELRTHLTELSNHHNQLLSEFKNETEKAEIESFMLAALENSDEHDLVNTPKNLSILPDSVIESFLADEDGE